MSTTITPTEQNIEINVNNDVIDINVTNEIVDVNATTQQIDINVAGAYPLPNAVLSVFGRTGQVVATEGDYTLTQLGDVTLTSPTNGQVLKYNGTTWVNGTDSGTVTSVAITETGDALTITGSPITTSGTINIGFAGTGAQYVKGDGTLATFPTTIAQAERLITEVYNSTGATLTKGTIVYINGGQGNLPTVTKALATGDATSAQTFGVVQADITNMNNGYVVVAGKLSDLDTQAYTEGTQLYLSATTAGTWTSTKQYAPNHLVYIGIVVRAHPTQGIVEVKIQNGYEMDELHNVAAQTPSNNDGLFWESATNLWKNKSIATILGYTPQAQLNGTGFVKASGTSITYDNSTYVTTDTFQNISASKTFDVGFNLASAGGTNQLTNFVNTNSIHSGSAGINVLGFNNSNNIYFGKGLNNGGVIQWNNSTVRYYTLPDADGTIALVGGSGVGTVTSVGLSSATSGVTIGSSPITTSGTITLAIATASGSQQGLLSSTDWTTFNNKQNALTNPVTGTGTTNTLPKFTGASTIGNSNVTDTGSLITLGSNSYVNGRLGIGSTGFVGTSLNISRAITGSTTSYGVVQEGVVASTTTTAAYGIVNGLYTAAAAFTLPNYTHFWASAATLGSGSAVTNQYGFSVDSTLTGATNNYGFFGNIPAGTGRWNLYMNGTANNYLAGALGIGTPNPQGNLHVGGGDLVLGGTTGQIRASSATFGTGGAIQVSASNTVANQYVAFGQALTGTGAFTERMRLVAGSGNLLLNTTTDAGFRLDVNGTARVQNTLSVGNSFFIGLNAQCTFERISNVSRQILTSQNIAGARPGYLFGVDSVQLDRGLINNRDGAYIALVNGANSNSTNYTERLIVFNNGNIAINTATDAGFRLDVNGTARVSGNTTLATGQDGLRIGADSNLLTNSANTSKRGRINVPQYGNPNSLPVGIISGATDSASNSITIGGTQGGFALAADTITFQIGATYNATSGTEIARFASNGALGIGTTSLTGVSLNIVKTLTGSVNSNGISQSGVIQSDVTGSARYNDTYAQIQNTAFTLGNLFHYRAGSATFTGATVTNQYGFYVDSTAIGATNNYAFFGGILSGTNRWNLYMSGTANNYIAGSLGIGSTALTGYTLRLGANLTGATTSYAIRNTGIVQSDVTSSAFGVSNTLQTVAAAFTLGNYYHFAAGQSTIGAGSALTNQYGYFVDSTLIGATNNYGFFGNIASGTNRWNLYMAGTASNYMAGNLLLNTTTDAGFKLDVNGTARVQGAATFSGGINANGGLQMGGQVLGFDQSGVRSWNIQATGGNLRFQSGDGLGAATFTGDVKVKTLEITNVTTYGSSAGISTYMQITVNGNNYVIPLHQTP